MKKLKFSFTLILILCLLGCAKVSVKPTPQQDTLDTKGLTFKAQRVDAGSLEGGLVIQPFKSGEGVEASAAVEQASLMMVKGFTEVMEKGNSAIDVITDNNTSKARFFIKGYIVKCEKSTGLVDYATKKPNVFAVEGKMVNLDNNRIVIDFSSSIQSLEKSDLSDFAYQIGQKLAAYLVEQSSGSL